MCLIFKTLVAINNFEMIMNKKRYAFLLLLLIQFGFGQNSKGIEKRIYTTKSLENLEAPIIDGLLADASWDIVDWQSFRSPDTNQSSQ